MYSVFTTYNEHNLPVLHVSCIRNNNSVTESSRELLDVIAIAAMNTAQTVYLRGSRGIGDFTNLIHRIMHDGNTLDLDAEGNLVRLFSIVGNVDGALYTLPFPEGYSRGEVGWKDYISVLFENIPLFASYLNTVDAVEKYLSFKAVADDNGVSISSARGASTTQIESSLRQADFCIADTFVGLENISAILAGRMSSVYKDENGNELRLVGGTERTRDGLEVVSKILNDRAINQRQIANIQAIQADFKRVARNMGRQNDRALAVKYDEGYKAAMKVVSLIGKHSDQWHVVMSDELPYTSDTNVPYVVYHGPRIECDSIMKDGIMYQMPDDLKGQFFIDTIAIRVRDSLGGAMAQGWMPHRAGETEEETVTSENSRWGGLCIGDLDGEKFERFIEIPEMLKTVYWHSMYPGTPSLATAMLFGFFEKNEDVGDYYNKQDGEYYSAELVEGELGA